MADPLDLEALNDLLSYCDRSLAQGRESDPTAANQWQRRGRALADALAALRAHETFYDLATAYLDGLNGHGANPPEEDQVLAAAGAVVRFYPPASTGGASA